MPRIRIGVLEQLEERCLLAAVTYQFSGAIDDIFARDEAGSDASAAFRQILPFKIGDRFSGSFTYDTDAPDLNVRTDIADYQYQSTSLAHTLRVNVGDANVQTQPASYFGISVRNFSSFDAFAVFSLAPQLPSGWSVSGGIPRNPQFYVHVGGGASAFNEAKFLPRQQNLWVDSGSGRWPSW